jgi:Lar family restriction alleviation protein
MCVERARIIDSTKTGERAMIRDSTRIEERTTQPMTDEQLAPCPFCGSAPELLLERQEVFISCPECDVCAPVMPRAEAIAAWNRRVPEPWEKTPPKLGSKSSQAIGPKERSEP